MAMKLETCKKCGYKVFPDEDFCPNCGAKMKGTDDSQKENHEEINKEEGIKFSPMKFTIVTFMIIGTIVRMLLHPVIAIFSVTLTILYIVMVRRHDVIPPLFKIATLIFVSIIGGALMFIDKER